MKKFKNTVSTNICFSLLYGKARFHILIFYMHLCSHFTFAVKFLSCHKVCVACSVQAELGQMATTDYYDANSMALDSKLPILQNTFTYRIQHESH